MNSAIPISILVSIGLVIFNVPVGYAFGAGVLIAAFGSGVELAAPISATYSNLESFLFLSLPLFIFLGVAMERSGMGERLTNVCSDIVGGVRGGMGIVVIVACAVFGAVSGAGSAAVASVGSVLIPRAVSLGYPKGYMVGLVACSSVLTLLIPPSIPMLVLALTLHISIAASFLTTVVPAVLIAVGYSLVNIVLVQKMPTVMRTSGISLRARASQVGKSGKRAFWPLVVPIVVLGSIYGGLASPTEAAGLGVVYVAVVSLFVLKSLSIGQFLQASWEAGRLIGALIIILVSLILFSQVLINEGMPFEVAEFLQGDLPKWQILLLLNLILLVIGMVMDDISGSIIAASIIYPIVSGFDVQPLHFAAIVGVNLGMGNVTPPVAPLLYLASGVAGNVPMNEYVGPVLKFLFFAHLPILIVVTFFPEISLFLPRLAGYL